MAVTPSLFTCSWSRLDEHARRLKPELVVSILGASDIVPHPLFNKLRHLKLRIDDVNHPAPGAHCASRNDIRQLTSFLEAWDGRARLLIHCWAGTSRSAAAALIALAQKNPGREIEAGRLLRERGPHLDPNERMVRLADEILGLRGWLLEGLREMGEPSRARRRGDLIRLPAFLP